MVEKLHSAPLICKDKECECTCRAGLDLFCRVADVIFTRGSLSNTMLHHMMEAQASATWELLETTTRGRVLAWTDTRGGKRHCVPSHTHTHIQKKKNTGRHFISRLLTTMVQSSPACWSLVSNLMTWSSSTILRFWRRRITTFRSQGGFKFKKVLWARRDRFTGGNTRRQLC